MNLQEFFKQVRDELEKRSIAYAMAGGFVASVYRTEPRATQDLDFFILAKTREDEVATELIESFGLSSRSVRKADLEGGPMFAIKKKNTPINMVVGRSDEKPGLDLILSNIKWSEGVMERAQANKVDFGFGPIPCLTKKLHSLIQPAKPMLIALILCIFLNKQLDATHKQYMRIA